MPQNGYAEAPWIFKGSALYQLHLVRADEARKHIPSTLKLVEFAGWTLGGLYLARYHDSPAGAFDEMVVLAGLVWNRATSCAWAQRVYVNSKQARDHGVQCVGLPSRFATFSPSPAPPTAPLEGRAPQPAPATWWDRNAPAAQSGIATGSVLVSTGDRVLRGRQAAVATVSPPAMAGPLGPRFTMDLPSFSGATRDCPGLLQYTCKMDANIRPVGAVSSRPEAWPSDQSADDVRGVLESKPLLCLAFDNMTMTVPKPQPLLRMHSEVVQPSVQEGRGVMAAWGRVQP